MNLSILGGETSVEERKYARANPREEIEASHIDEGISDISAVGNLEGVAILNVHCNKLSSLKGLPRLPSLTELNLSSNLFSDSSVEGLSNLPNLRTLDLSGNNLKALTGLPYMPFLEKFIAAFNDIDNLDGIDGFPSLTVLDMRGNKLRSTQSFAGLEMLSNLKELSLAGDDGRNANPVCASPDTIVDIFDTYCYFGAIDHRTREEWSAPRGGGSAKMTGASFAAVAKAASSKLPYMKRTPDITPKFDAVVKKFLSRARAGGSVVESVQDTDEGDHDEFGHDYCPDARADVPSHDDVADDISEITNSDYDGIDKRIGDMSSWGRKTENLKGAITREKDQVTRRPTKASTPFRPDSSRNNPWTVQPSRGSTAGKVKGTSTAFAQRTTHKSLSSRAHVSPTSTTDASNHRAPDREYTSRSECADKCTQSDDAPTDKETALSGELVSSQRRLHTTLLAGRIGSAALCTSHRRDLTRSVFLMWKTNALEASLCEQREQLLQENQLLRLTSERASKSAEVARTTTTLEVAQLKRALSEEKVKSEAVKRQLVKLEALAQSQRKELLQAKQMCKDQEESLTAKCAEEMENAEVQLLSAKKMYDLECSDLRRKLDDTTQLYTENQSLCSHLQDQVKSLCDQLKSEQSRACRSCTQWSDRVNEMEKNLQEVKEASSATLQQSTSRAEDLERDLSALTEKYSQLKDTGSQQAQVIDEWMQKYGTLSRSFGDAVGEKKKLEKQLNKVAAGYASLRTENGQLKDNLDIVNEDNESNKKKVSELRGVTQELKDVLRKVTERCRHLESKQNPCEDNITTSSNLHIQLESALEQVELLRKDREDAARALAESEARSVAEIGDLMETQRDLELSVRVKEKMIDDQNASIRRLKERQREDEERLQEGMRHLEEEVEEMRDEVSELERQLEVSREEEKTAMFRVQELETGREETEEKLREACKAEVDMLKSRLNSRDRDLESVQVELSDIGEILRELRVSSGQKDERITKLIAELESMERQYKQSSDELQQEKEKRLALLREVQEMRDHIASVVEREKVILELKKALKNTRQQLEESAKKAQKMDKLFAAFQRLADKAVSGNAPAASLSESLELLASSFPLGRPESSSSERRRRHSEDDERPEELNSKHGARSDMISNIVTVPTVKYSEHDPKMVHRQASTRSR